MQREEILNRIAENIMNSDNYLYLAESYFDLNLNLAYLSLENAMFMEKNQEKKDQIKVMMDGLKSEGNISVSQVSFIILSFHNLNYTRDCIDSIRMTCCPGSYEIIVVDNGSEEEVVSWLKEQTDIKLILNDHNKGFPAGCNQGIKLAARGNDIFLLNNDTVMLPNTLYCMRMALYNDTKNGAAGAMATSAANGQVIPTGNDINKCFSYAIKNNVPDECRNEKKIWLQGFALLIRHDVQEKVGLLDERFTPGNFEDNDYSYRVLEAGYQNILCHSSFLIHYGNKSTDVENEVDKYKDLCTRNFNKINEKWGFNTSYYMHQRDEIIELIVEDHPNHEDAFSVLECGCGMGATLLKLQYLYPNIKVIGVEIVEKVAALGRSVCDIYQGNVEKMDLGKLVDGTLDYVIFGDVLEHLKDPYEVLKKCHGILKPAGKIVASLPNIMHYSVILPLLKGHFSFDDEGIRDYTHLHNFTQHNICVMFRECGYDIEKMNAIIIDSAAFTDIEKKDLEWFVPLIKSGITAPEEQFNTFQYIVRVRNRGHK